MTDHNTKRIPPETKKELGAHYEDVIWRLFDNRGGPLFQIGTNHLQVGAFAEDDEVIFEVHQFAEKMVEIWKSRFDVANNGPQLFVKSPDAPQKTARIQFHEFPAEVVTAPGSNSAIVELTLLQPQPVSNSNSGVPVSPQQIAPKATDSRPAQATEPVVAAQDKQAPPQGSLPNPSVVSTELKPGQIPATTAPSPRAAAVLPSFHLPNCKVGTSYSAKIEGSNSSGQPILVTDLRLPDGIGIAFDPVSQVVSGEPKVDGEFELPLQWAYLGSQVGSSGVCRLTSNPDPKSLWKVIEPAPDLPYRKAHLDQKLLKGKGFNIAAASRRGRSHEHGGTFRDDDFFISDDAAVGWSVMIVADGAGSAKSSREGSRIAVEKAGTFLVDALAGDFGVKISGFIETWDSEPSSQSAIATEFHYFYHKMALAAVQAIEQEAQAQNAPVKEYSTTLLVAAVKRSGSNTFLATFWMGDGAIAAYGPRGIVKLMGTPDGGEFAGQTRFLDRNALADQGFGKRVRIGWLQDFPSVVLMTDGVSDPKFETDNGLADPAKWDALWDEIEPLLNDVAPEQKLIDWLHFFAPGHHDDRTIALFW